jgi:CubicO group peptidase (beta-lactamase class C family)
MTNDGHHYHTDGGLYMTPRDMARLGYLMLHDGVWEGERLLPEGWVDQATTAQFETGPNHGYAYQWWTIEDADIFYASGHYDQAIYVIPQADMVVVFTANVPDEAIHPLEGFLFRYILGACTDLPDDYLNRQYAAYGFSFPYNRDFFYREEPFPGTDGFSSQAGVVQFSYIGYPIELFTVMWNDALAGMTVDETRQAAAAFLSEDPGLTVTRRESTEMAVGDRDIRVDTFDVETEGFFLTAALGAWSCDSSEKTYVISFVSNYAAEIGDLTVRFAELLGSFSCIESE